MLKPDQMIKKNITNLIDADVLITVLRLASYDLKEDIPSLTITYIGILKYLNFAFGVSKERIKESLTSLLDISFSLDRGDEIPVITSLYFLDNGEGVTIYFHSKIFWALRSGCSIDDLNKIPAQVTY